MAAAARIQAGAKLASGPYLAHVKDRRSILESRWLRPFSHWFGHPALWHLNRRTGPRALAIGLFAGFILPFGQFLLAALLSVPLRANVPLAAAATLVSNPLTFPPIYFAAYRLGREFVGEAGATPIGSDQSTYLSSLWALSGPTAIGLLTFAVTSAIVGYLLSRLWWNCKITRRWKLRRYASSISFM
jgi:uncharacterized protein (DUF2062 family)